MVTLIGGVVGGLVGTGVMTGLMMLLGDDSPPPSALVLAKLSGGSPDDYRLAGMVIHVLYGLGAGAVFALLGILGLYAIGNASSPGLIGGVLNGLVYGLVLFVVAAAGWMKGVLGMMPEPQQIGTFLGLHLVYGAVLGAVVGTVLV